MLTNDTDNDLDDTPRQSIAIAHFMAHAASTPDSGYFLILSNEEAQGFRLKVWSGNFTPDEYHALAIIACERVIALTSDYESPATNSVAEALKILKAVRGRVLQ